MSITILRPYLLLLLIPIIYASWLLYRKNLNKLQILPKHLSILLVNNKTSSLSTLVFIFFMTLLVISVVGISPGKKTLAGYEGQVGTVICYGLDRNMYIQDIPPGRLLHARVKTISLLDFIKDGDIGLVTYAKHGYRLTGMSHDNLYIKYLIPILTPEIMPDYGANMFEAIYEADKMLEEGKYLAGNIIIIADGADKDSIEQTITYASNLKWKVSVLGVTTTAYESEIKSLKKVADAGNGVFKLLSSDNSDLLAITDALTYVRQNIQNENNSLLIDVDIGYIFTPLILIFAAFFFRKGFIYIILLSSFFIGHKNAYALDWKKWFLNEDQRAYILLKDGKSEEAARLFKNKNWQAFAYYGTTNRERACKAWKSMQEIDGLYNCGVMRLHQERIDEALELFEDVVAIDPNHKDALYNINFIKSMGPKFAKQTNNDNDGEKGNKKQKKQKKKQKIKAMLKENKDNQLKQLNEPYDPAFLIRRQLYIDYRHKEGLD